MAAEVVVTTNSVVPSPGYWVVYGILALIFLILIIWLVIWLVDPGNQTAAISVVTAIAPPSNVQAIALLGTTTVGRTSGNVQVTWIPPNHRVDSYRLYYGTQSNFTPSGPGITVPGSQTSQVITIPSRGTYYIKMQSVLNGVQSHYSNASNAVTVNGTSGSNTSTIAARRDATLYMTNNSCGQLVVKSNYGLAQPNFLFEYGSDNTLTQVSSGYQIYVDHHGEVRLGAVPEDLQDSGNNNFVYYADRRQFIYANDRSQALTLSDLEDGSRVVLANSGLSCHTRTATTKCETTCPTISCTTVPSTTENPTVYQHPTTTIPASSSPPLSTDGVTHYHSEHYKPKDDTTRSPSPSDSEEHRSRSSSPSCSPSDHRGRPRQRINPYSQWLTTFE